MFTFSITYISFIVFKLDLNFWFIDSFQFWKFHFISAFYRWNEQVFRKEKNVVFEN